VFAGRGRGRGNWICGNSCQCGQLLEFGEQFPSVEYNHNNGSNSSSGDVCHSHSSASINNRIATILPGGWIHYADQ
jgi:hypothetical protein